MLFDVQQAFNIIIILINQFLENSSNFCLIICIDKEELNLLIITTPLHVSCIPVTKKTGLDIRDISNK